MGGDQRVSLLEPVRPALSYPRVSGVLVEKIEGSRPRVQHCETP